MVSFAYMALSPEAKKLLLYTTTLSSIMTNHKSRQPSKTPSQAAGNDRQKENVDKRDDNQNTPSVEREMNEGQDSLEDDDGDTRMEETAINTDPPSPQPTPTTPSSSGTATPKRARDNQEEQEDDRNTTRTTEPNAKRRRTSPSTSSSPDRAENEATTPPPETEDTTPRSPSNGPNEARKHKLARDAIYFYWGIDSLTDVAPEGSHLKCHTADEQWRYDLLYRFYQLAKQTRGLWHGPRGVGELLEEWFKDRRRFSETNIRKGFEFVEGELGKRKRGEKGKGDEMVPGVGEGDLEIRHTGVPGSDNDGDSDGGDKHDDNDSDKKRERDERANDEKKRKAHIRFIEKKRISIIDDLVTEEMRQAFKSDKPMDWEQAVLAGLHDIVRDLHAIDFLPKVDAHDVRRELHKAWNERTAGEPGETRMLVPGDVQRVLTWLMSQPSAEEALPQSLGAGDSTLPDITQPITTHTSHTNNQQTEEDRAELLKIMDAFTNEGLDETNPMVQQSILDDIDKSHRENLRTQPPTLTDATRSLGPSAPIFSRARSLVTSANRALRMTNLSLSLALSARQTAEAYLAAARSRRDHEVHHSRGGTSAEEGEISARQVAVAEAKRILREAHGEVVRLRIERWNLENPE
ncbi:hypothetical protein CC86DRAFT_407515 [Ophiobolus disseminans]|uniref:Uncharacterized protein n=1 Tax=Ophiobolus disseminans TaxID=1469910 RepID=A0A6A6ZWT2_9PLEO|nr:hypothetical protein CC86DRAFT_407515 [Ophiobolus disseminans]